MTGRPTKRTPEIVDKILWLLASGKSLNQAAEEAGVLPQTFLGWEREDKELSEQYARARSIGSDIRFDAIREVAAKEPERDDKGNISSGWVANQRLIIDSMKWELSKMKPERYGDKIDVTSKGDKVGFAINIDMGEKP